MLSKILPKKQGKKIITTYTQTTKTHYPFYIKAAMVLLGIFLLFYMLKLLQDILVPIVYAGLIAIILNPIVNKLRSWRMPKFMAIAIAIFLAVLVFGGIVTFISSQLISFADFAPQLQERGSMLMNNIQVWLSETLDLSNKKQANLFDSIISPLQSYIGQAVSTIFEVFGMFTLIPIYAFLLLYYKPLFLNFFYEVFDTKHENKVTDVLNEAKSAIQTYIFGLLIEMLIVAALNSTALLILGVKYAILLGFIGAILNLIPYIGGLVAITLPMVLSFVLGDGSFTTPLLVLGAYIIIQLIDNNIIVPLVVSSKVEVNALVSIIIVLLGGALWGVSGMFLSIPFIAICKIIFDRVDYLKPWGMILGTDMDETFTLKPVEIDENSNSENNTTDDNTKIEIVEIEEKKTEVKK